MTSVLDDQEEKIEEVMQAVQGLGTATVGQKSLYPYYSGNGIPTNSNVTFNIYASVAIYTNIDEMSELVSGLQKPALALKGCTLTRSIPWHSCKRQRSSTNLLTATKRTST